MERHLPTFEKLTTPWRWIVVEGAAMNVKCTTWCKPQQPRLSRDGTAEYLTKISRHPNVTVIRKQSWAGKVDMCNACVVKITEPCTLIQVDVDEFWSAEQIEMIHTCFKMGQQYNRAHFCCDYFVGPNIVTVGENCYGNNPGEWLRAWRFTPGDAWVSHEPPYLKQQCPGQTLDREATRRHGLVFRHEAYTLESQVAFKERFYGYRDAVKHWKRLQDNTDWPVKRLKNFLPWVDDRVGANRI